MNQAVSELHRRVPPGRAVKPREALVILFPLYFLVLAAFFFYATSRRWLGDGMYLVALFLGQLALTVDLGNRAFGYLKKSGRRGMLYALLMIFFFYLPFLVLLGSGWAHSPGAFLPLWVRIYAHLLGLHSTFFLAQFPFLARRLRPQGDEVRAENRMLNVEGMKVRVWSYEVFFDSLPSEFSGFSIVHLSDIHYGVRVGKHFRAIMELVDSLEPDVVVVTGDLAGDEGKAKGVARHLGRIRAGSGVYAVLGNEDLRGAPEELREHLATAGVKVLSGKQVMLARGEESLSLYGTEFPWQGEKPAGMANGKFRILLSHTPDNCSWAGQVGVGLMLSGHTHGGQITLPLVGPILVPSRYSRILAAGWYKIGGMMLYVNRGLGSHGFPRRLSPPEIVRIKLYRR